MDDVFDFSETDKEVELRVANQEWLKRMRDVAVTGEREALGDCFETRADAAFDKGLNDGFEAAKDVALLKGRLTYYKASETIDRITVTHLLTELESLESEILRELPSNRENVMASRIVLPENISSKIISIKEEISRLLAS